MCYQGHFLRNGKRGRCLKCDRRGVAIPLVGALSSIGGAVSGLFQGFFHVIPGPLKIIIFLFLLVVMGSVISGLFLDGKYACEYDIDEERNDLYDIVSYDRCLSEFGTAWALKHDLEGSALGNLSGARESVNESTKNFFVRMMEFRAHQYNRQSTFGGTLDVYKEVWDNFALWRDNDTAVGFLDAFKSSFIEDDFSCRRLYRCLPLEEAEELGLSEGCGLSDVPEWADFEAVTRKPLGDNSLVTGEEQQDAFRVQCSDLSSGDEPAAVLTFYGFEFLNYQIWMLLFVVGALVVGVAKLKGFID